MSGLNLVADTRVPSADGLFNPGGHVYRPLTVPDKERMVLGQEIEDKLVIKTVR